MILWFCHFQHMWKLLSIDSNDTDNASSCASVDKIFSQNKGNMEENCGSVNLCIDYPTDSYLFRNVILPSRLVKDIIKNSPCQSGLKKEYNFYVRDKTFLKTCYNKRLG